MSKQRRRAQTAQLVAVNNVSNFNDYVTRTKKIQLVPKSLNQEKYIDLLNDSDKLIIFAAGPAGTGKTMLAVLAALKAYKEGEISKIVITRPAVGVDDEQHGFLPGTLNQKMEPWTRPIFDIIAEYYRPQEIAKMLEEQQFQSYCACPNCTEVMAASTLTYNHRHLCPTTEKAEPMRNNQIDKFDAHLNSS